VMIPKKADYFIGFDETPIYFEIHGEGLPIVLCYGIVCTMNHWRHQVRALASQYQLIMYDFRGHHKTPMPSRLENLSLDAIARDAWGLLDHLQIKTSAFIGHSWGAQVMARIYDLEPERVSSMIMINGFAQNPFKDMFGLPLDRAVESAQIVYSKMPSSTKYLWQNLNTNPLSGLITGLLGGFNLNLTSFRDIEIYGSGVANVEVPVFLKLTEDIIHYDAKPAFERVKAPTLIIGGAKDRVTPLKYQQEIHERISGSELEIIPFGSHCCQLDMPDLVNLRIEKHLRLHQYV